MVLGFLGIAAVLCVFRVICGSVFLSLGPTPRHGAGRLDILVNIRGYEDIDAAGAPLICWR
jgi:hypothetical protein